MEEYARILVSDPSLQSEFTQAELRVVKAQFTTLLNKNGRKLTAENLPFEMLNLNDFKVSLTENEVATLVRKQYRHSDDIVDFEGFLRVYLSLQTQTDVNSVFSKNNSAFLKSGITTFLHTISESEKAAYMSHINRYLANDPEIERFLPIDPTTDDLFDMVKDGILLCKLINVAVPGTIDERAINTREKLNPWEMIENHTLCLNSAKAIGCTVVNIGSQDLIEGRPHLVLGLISQIIKIQLLADLNLKKTPELVELAEDAKDVENLMNLPPEMILLKWMNFHLQKAGYSKTVSNFSSDIKDGEAYAVLLNVLAPEHCSPVNLTNDPMERAKLVISQAEKMDCRSYVSPQDIVEGSSSLNMAFVAHLFNQRKGLSLDTNKLSFAGIVEDDIDSREEKTFRLWINSLYIDTYVNNIFEDLRSGWVLLEVLNKVSPGSVNWKHANQPPIKMPFRKVENCNQAVKIGKQLKLSLVNVSGNDIVQGNKKLILAFLWQLMRHNMLQLVKSLKRYSNDKDISDVSIMKWANAKIKAAGHNSRIESFRDKSLANGIFFLELLSSVEPKAVNWYIVTKGETEEQKRLNATYVISVARKLGCSLFLLPEDIVEVNHKMLLTLTASIMHWCLTTQRGDDSSVISDCETGSVNGSLSNLAIDDSTSEASSLFDNGSE